MESLLRLMNLPPENLSHRDDGTRAFIFTFMYEDVPHPVLVIAKDENDAVEEAAHHAAEKGWDWVFYENKPHKFPEELYEDGAYVYTESGFIDNGPMECLEEVGYEEALVAFAFQKITKNSLQQVLDERTPE